MRAKMLSIFKKNKAVSLQDFIFHCAKREWLFEKIPADQPIPTKFVPKTKEYDEKIEKLKELIKATRGWDADRLAVEEGRLKVDYEKKLKKYQQDLTASLRLKKRYEAMLTRLDKWQPFGHNHLEFKRSMINELKAACESSPQKPEKISIKVYQKQLIKHYRSDLTVLESERKADIENCQFKTKWVRELWESLLDIPDSHQVGTQQSLFPDY